MQLQLDTLSTFLPGKHALFVNSAAPVYDIHHNGELIAFSTRQHEIVLRNQKTGAVNILQNDSHQTLSLKFTHEYLLASKQSVREILVYSLKTIKLKSKLTGHRSNINKLIYCRQHGLFLSISHDQCMIFSEVNLTRLKTLRCSTSSFTDCAFTDSGQYLFTAFKDSTAFMWNLDNFSQKQFFLHTHTLISANTTSIIASYNRHSISLADYNRELINFQAIQPFWEGNINKVELAAHYLIVSTKKAIYIAELEYTHLFEAKNVGLITKTDSFAVGVDHSQVLVLSDDLKLFSITSIREASRLFSKTVINPLDNPGLCCSGGYSNINGCHTACDLKQTNNYSQVQHQLQQLCLTNYTRPGFSSESLCQFVAKHHLLPDKYRPLAYLSLLKLPISPASFRNLESKGLHDCVQFLDSKYPLANQSLADKLKKIVSLLAHLHSIFSEAETVPSIVFPLVCLFGNDEFLCFQILYRLFSNWLNFLFSQFPLANSQYLQNLQDILRKEDLELLRHLQNKGIALTKLAWPLLSSLFTSCLPRQSFLAVLDNLFVRSAQPEYLMFIVIGFIEYNRVRILTMQTQTDIKNFIDTEQTIHIAKLLATSDQLAKKHAKMVVYEFPQSSFQCNQYHLGAFEHISKDAVAMYAGRRKLLAQEQSKAKEQSGYKEKLLKEMTAMAEKERKDSERALIKKDAYELLKETESKKVSYCPQDDRRQRIQSIGQLIQKVTTTIESQEKNKETMKAVIPAYSYLEKQNDEQLSKIEYQLMKMLSQFRPISFNQPLYRQPFSLQKSVDKQQNGFKAALTSSFANKLHELNRIEAKQQSVTWENNMMKAMVSESKQ